MGNEASKQEIRAFLERAIEKSKDTLVLKKESIKRERKQRAKKAANRYGL